MLKSHRSLCVSFSRTGARLCIYHLIIIIIIIIIIILLVLESFSRQSYLMIFHGSLRDSKSLQASRTLLGILADLNNIAVWIVLFLPPISNSSSPFSRPLGIVPNAPITIGIKLTLMLHNVLSSPTKSKYLSLFCFPWFSLCGFPEWLSLLFSRFSFFVIYYHQIWSSGRVKVIRLYLKITENFNRLNLIVFQVWISCTISCGSPFLPSCV